MAQSGNAAPALRCASCGLQISGVKGLTLAHGRLERRFGFGGSGRLAAYLKPSNFVLVGCVLVALWFVLVPVSALFYNAFTEDTGFGPGAFSLENFVEAYSSWQILALFRNSLV